MSWKNDLKRFIGKKSMSEEDKRAVIAVHYKYNVMQKDIAEYIGKHKVSISKWKKLYGEDATVFKYGSHVRNDVRTKCLCVKRFIEGKETIKDLAAEYHVAVGTIYYWIKMYNDTYMEYLDLPDGVAVIANKNRLIFGKVNIDEYLSKLDVLIGTIEDLVTKSKVLGISKSTESELKTKIKAFTKQRNDLLGAANIMEELDKLDTMSKKIEGE